MTNNTFNAADTGRAIARLCRTATTNATKAKTHLRQAAAFSIVAFADTLQVAVTLVYDPEKAVNGTDENAAFRSLKAMAATVAKSHGFTVSIKAGVVTVDKAEQPEEDCSAVDGDGDGEEGGETQGDALWAAVELVLANLGNPAVLSAIRSGLEGLANTKGRN